ncbi:MAG: CDP-alcohol phosphatidyltransferase family protein [Acutalibacteraceae bacterium]|nr:CDP-alcohol phosphatidyltransferase family protein [Acutalibacteraceae bacterium]
MSKQIANIITISRILSCIYLLLCPVFSISFYIMYLFCGITDMADGIIARKTKSISELGARLDTVADSVFVAVCFVKILPLMQFPAWLWTWIVIIAIIKIGNVILGLISNKKLVSIHTILNKVTGFLLFLLPLTFSFIEPIYSSVVVCLMATLSAINELYLIRIGKEVF